MANLLTKTLFLSLSLSLVACGEKKEGGDEDTTKTPAASTQGKTDDGPAIDCPAFTAKATECLEPLAEAYAKTEKGAKPGTGTDGTVDHAKAAKMFKMVWGMEGEKLCAEGGAMGLAFAKYDKRWKERLIACDASAACDVWAGCMATALGEPLK